MTPEEHKRAGDLFDRIRALPDGEQAVALDKACAGEVELRARVARLLGAGRHAFEEKFLARPALEDAAEIVIEQHAQLPAAGSAIGPYRLVRRIGAGGMGVVYEAEDPRLNRRVALKLLPCSDSQEPIQRFQREAQAAAQLNHPHIAAIYDTGLDRGFYYIAMELVEGRTLREVLASEGGFVESRRLLEWLGQIASALSAAHAAGVIHRDIKPENIMLRADGFVKVLDFGLASVREPASRPEKRAFETRPGQLPGTVHYFSPEQLMGRPATPQSDLFSLGVVAYEMATGTRPFDGPADGAVFDAILHAEIAAPSTIRPSLEREFDDLVRHALEKDPELRYQTASDFRSSCLRLIRHSTPSNANAARPRLRWKDTRRAFRLRGLAAALVALAAGVSVAWWLDWLSPAAPRVRQIVQITRSREPVSHFVSDGGRIYFSTGRADGDTKMLQVGADGGEPIPLPQLDGMFPQDLLPSRSQLLLAQVNRQKRFGPFPLWVAATLGGAPRRLGDVEAQFARWSPRGDRILYSQQGSLRLASADGSDSHEIAHVNGFIEEGAWSPDGQRMRFSVSLPNSRRIWEVRADGSGLRPVAFRGWHEPWAEMGTWTPDGEYFVFSAGEVSHDLWVKREGRFGSTLRLTHGPLWDLRPQPSADGKRIYFLESSNIGELIRFDPRSGQWLPFLGGMDAVQVAYSRNGQWIAFADSKGYLWRSAVDGSDRRQLTGPPLYARNPRWSHDGRTIVFHAGPVGQPDSVYVASASGSSVTRLTHSEKGAGEGDGNWSQDGKLILYSSPSNEADKKPYLYLLNVQTRRIDQLPESARLWSPRWSPDGKTVVALDENAHLRLYNMATHRAAALTSFPIGYPAWSLDNRYIYFENLSSTAWYRVDIERQRVELLKELPGLQTALNSSGWVGMTPDGTVISARAVNSSNLYALELEGK